MGYLTVLLGFEMTPGVGSPDKSSGVSLEPRFSLELDGSSLAPSSLVEQVSSVGLEARVDIPGISSFFLPE